MARKRMPQASNALPPPPPQEYEATLEAGAGGPDLGNAMRNTLLGDAASTGGQILGTVVGKQFQELLGGGASSEAKFQRDQAQQAGELNNQLKKAGTFATNAMGYKGAGAQISAKNAMAGFQPDAEDVMARNQANKQADKMMSGLQGQMAATNQATARQAGRAVDSTIKAAKQMGGPASLGAAAAGGAAGAINEGAMARSSQNAQAIAGANQAAAGMRTNAAQAFGQAKEGAFNRKVQPYMNQWHEPNSEAALSTGYSSGSSSSAAASDYPIYDMLAGTAQNLGTRGGYQQSVDMHQSSINERPVDDAPAEPNGRISPDNAGNSGLMPDPNNTAGILNNGYNLQNQLLNRRNQYNQYGRG